jgi:hypothetical protein
LEVLLDGISVNNISVRFSKHTESFLEEWNNYRKSNNLTITAITDKNSVFAKGKTTKEQIEFSLTEGKKRGDNPHFIF